MKKLIMPFLFLLSVAVVHAQTCSVTVTSQNTQDFLQEIPSINSQLQTCPVMLHKGASVLLGSGEVDVAIVMKDGSTEHFFLMKQGNTVTKISLKGSAPSYLVSTDEASVDAILQTNNAFGVFSTLYFQKKIRISGARFFSKFRMFFVKPAVRFVAKRNQVPVPSPSALLGKPDNCDETYVPGHPGYAANKDLWDQYTAGTDGACQSQFGRGIPSPCVHTVQLSTSGNPYYLCWYNT